MLLPIVLPIPNTGHMHVCAVVRVGHTLTARVGGNYCTRNRLAITWANASLKLHAVISRKRVILRHQLSVGTHPHILEMGVLHVQAWP